MNIKVKYYDDSIERIKFIKNGDWIDLRAKDDVVLKRGEFGLIHLGVAMELPKDYEAHVVPRSSTFKRTGLIQTNSVGIIDNSYCGDDDWWFMPVYATRDVKISKNERICQFRITKRMERVDIVEVDNLNNPNRDGHGSTGVS